MERHNGQERRPRTGVDERSVGVERERLLGRAEECALLDGLAADIRRGESRALVLRGDAGIGKTALLEHLVESASDLTVLRAVGVESEMELAYAGLHLLCGPLLGRLSGIPAPQRQALETVFGLGTGAPPDGFLVGLGVLSLLSDAANERPLLCIVDDAQWLDHASALVLAFVARRLQADRVGIVFAAREPGEELKHLPELDVRGLVNGVARALLSSAVRFKLDAQVRDRIIAETHGNPLALLELPQGLTAVSELAFSEPSGPPAWRRLPSWTVVATGDRAAGADVIRSMGERAGARIIELDGSHVIMISQPQAVTNVILEALAVVEAQATVA